jgi:D-glycero-D-manno-heptose 1,7-bisphosphate phosphatase
MDRDGTISEEVGYINHPDRLKLLKRSAKAIKMLNHNKLRAIVVTNQAGVGRGYFKEEMIGVVHKKMEEMLAKDGAYLDAIYYCPHHPKDNCNCRKPKAGMMLQAKEKFGLDLTKSYVIGDKYSDVEYAHQVGAKGILVLTGYGKGAYEFEKEQWSKGPDFVASDLYDAVEWIVKQEQK